MHKLQLLIDLIVDTGTLGEGTPAYVHMAVDTILRNAVEASARCDRRVLRITVSVIEGAAAVQVIIEDDGPGFAQVVPDQMAEAGSISIVTSARRERGVSGLGLLLVHQVMQLHQGQPRSGNRQPQCARVEPRFPSLERRTDRNTLERTANGTIS